MTQDMITLGFDRIIQQLQDQAVSQAAKQRLAETEPILSEGLCRARMEETTDSQRRALQGPHGGNDRRTPRDGKRGYSAAG